MNIQLIVIGKTDLNELDYCISNYLKRLKKYVNFQINIISDIKKSKSLSISEQKKLESEKILSKLNSGDYIVLLDESGKNIKSEEFAEFINKRMISGIKNLVFIVGGPYGVDKKVFEKANFVLSLSKMTFSHQMIRLFFVEQCYRAFTILNNEPYHHA